MSKRLKLLKKLKKNQEAFDDFKQGLKTLRQLLKDKDLYLDEKKNPPGMGICNHCFNSYGSRPYIQKVFQKWKLYSGDKSYPVVDTEVEKTPEDQYLWAPSKYSGTYGKLRFKLIKFCLHTFEKDLKKLEK